MSVTQVLLTIAVVLGALALSAALGAPLTSWLLARMTRGSTAQSNGTHAPDEGGEEGADAPSDPRTPEEALRGGLWIGILERLAITGCILVGYPAGIAVVVAIKGLGRFRTLGGQSGVRGGEAGVSERFLVGTLTSFLWACGIGIGGVGLLGLIS
ncbi:hypothetical protein [Ruania alba]|uniref:Uncharacterized protein n=1 Tax=Ruania alba TaxID=648782 RepID=A0A1H5FT99_9MICO|nr:hypothetical protein [Ruania alba]SEE06607.1 hypothetical protein SAMN04488554_1439 [Ruania alba]